VEVNLNLSGSIARKLRFGPVQIIRMNTFLFTYAPQVHLVKHDAYVIEQGVTTRVCG
jgi:hypothetical protein